MNGAEIVFKYFSGLSDLQQQQFVRMGKIYSEINLRINLISRKDIENLYERHILHSLAVARAFDFPSGVRVVDIGTGGGFPGVPLAVLRPDVYFVLIDSTGKKIKAVERIIQELELRNAEALQGRMEEVQDCFHYATSRATAPLKDLIRWMQGKFFPGFDSALICLKGGPLVSEISEAGCQARLFSISGFFEEPFFKEKSVVVCSQPQA